MQNVEIKALPLLIKTDDISMSVFDRTTRNERAGAYNQRRRGWIVYRIDRGVRYEIRVVPTAQEARSLLETAFGWLVPEEGV